MASYPIHTLDLKFQNKSQAIASYLIRDGDAVVLVECGPASTLGALEAGLQAQGLALSDVTHVLLTHIHLDHGGAAGHLARAGAQICVHPVGAPHLVNPERLLASASRIYGDQMYSLWGETLPVPADRLRVVNDEEEIVLGRLRFLALSTPGHAEHHHAYLFEEVCFSGDIGGVRIPGYAYVQAPMPPPELHIERWLNSLKRLRQHRFARIAPTHFGIYEDPAWQLDQLEQTLHSVARWLEQIMPGEPDLETLRSAFLAWAEQEVQRHGLEANVLKAYELANPLSMSADGLRRYWKKVRMTEQS